MTIYYDQQMKCQEGGDQKSKPAMTFVDDVEIATLNSPKGNPSLLAVHSQGICLNMNNLFAKP